MSKIGKVEERTRSFNTAMKYLIASKEIKTQKELAERLGIGGTAITEIKKERQNIQPDIWKKFKELYNWPRKNATDISVIEDDRDEIIVKLKEDILNLRVSNRVHTKLIKKLMIDYYGKRSDLIDEEYSNELIRSGTEE